MSAPPTLSLGTPHGLGTAFDEGFSTAIVFAINPNLSLWEIELSGLPNIDGGEPIMTSHMRNVEAHTFAPRKLKKYDPMKVMGRFSPLLYRHCDAAINQRTTATIHIVGGSTLDMYCYIQKAEFPEFKEGEEPKASLSIVLTNWDPVNRVEQKPVWTPAAGTGS